MAQEKLTHWKKYHNPDYLGAYAVEPGQTLIATIDFIRQEEVRGMNNKKEECMVAHFKEPDIKPMVLNATNCKAITKMYGTPYVEEWVGRRIEVYSTEVQAFGDMVEALRIKPKEPKATKPDLNPSHPRWKEAVKSLSTGSIGMEWIRKNFSITEENADLLKSEASRA